VWGVGFGYDGGRRDDDGTSVRSAPMLVELRSEGDERKISLDRWKRKVGEGYKMEVKKGHAFDTKLAAPNGSLPLLLAILQPAFSSFFFLASSSAGGDTERHVFPSSVCSSPSPAPPSARTAQQQALRPRPPWCEQRTNGRSVCLGPRLNELAPRHPAGRKPLRISTKSGQHCANVPAANGGRPRLSLIPA
jgi:hypothetical protein